MQEVVGAQDTGIPGGKDSYDFDFFPKEAFAPWPEEAAAFEARAGVKFLFGAAENSTMYRHSFGNAIAVKTSTLNVVDSKVQACLTAPTEAEGMEGRAAVTIVVQPVGGGGKLTVCCTHLTEKVVGEQGQKQSEMIESLLQGTLSDPLFAQHPTVLCGDFNINDVGGGMPPKSAAYCQASPFLHPHPDYDPYTRLAGAGFASAASAASAEGRSLHTCWNGGIVDYMGGRNGAVPLAFGCVSPTHNGQVVSDHRWPVGVYQFP
jgi:endonuclease/exonuclease/phosphatase family metal-dependent hydrolase